MHVDALYPRISTKHSSLFNSLKFFEVIFTQLGKDNWMLKTVFSHTIYLFFLWIEYWEQIFIQYWLKDHEDSKVGEMNFLLGKRREIFVDLIVV